MKLFDITGFVTVILGIAGMAGAIHFGTGYLTSSALLITGGFMLYITYKEYKDEKEKSNNIVIDTDSDTGTGRDSIRSGE